MVNFDIEDSFINIFNKNSLLAPLIAGIDEAGRGPLCGPVFSACVIILDRNSCPKNVDDSKKISEKNREKIFEEILKLKENKKVLFAIGLSSVEEIDTLNIREATKLSMQRSYYNLIDEYKIKPDWVIVDGNFCPDIDTKANCVVKGDQKSVSIAMASIIAKVSRDRLLRKMDLEYPQYNWKSNKGYGTKEHMNAIEKYGICKYHRKTFVH